MSNTTPHDLTAAARPSLSITLPPTFDFRATNLQMPKTPEAQQDEEQLGTEPPPPPRPQAFKVKRKRVISAPFAEADFVPSTMTVIPTIEMSEVPAEVSSPTVQPTSAHLLSPIPLSASLPRALTPPRTPAPKSKPIFSQLDSPADEWDLISSARPAFERSDSICSSFSDSSVSSYGSSDFSLPNGGEDSPDSEGPDPFTDTKPVKSDTMLQSPLPMIDGPKAKRIKTRRDVRWTQQMDDHLWLTFMAYLSDPTLTPFKMLPGTTPPMGVCDQVATRARRTWPRRKSSPTVADPSDVLQSAVSWNRQGSPDTIRPSTIHNPSMKWPKAAPTRKRLRELCTRRPSISAHYQRMLRTRSPSPFGTSSPAIQAPGSSSSFSGYDMVKSLVTSTAPSMQPDGPLARLASEDTTPPAKIPRPSRPDGWFDRIPRCKAHQKSLSLQSELNLGSTSHIPERSSHSLASPFDTDDTSSRSHLLHSMVNTRSLGRTEFNGKTLDSPVVFRLGAPTDRRSRKRRFRSDEEKPRRGALEDVFGPPMQAGIGRNRGFSVGAIHAADNLTSILTPPSIQVDLVMGDANDPSGSSTAQDAPEGSQSVPRRLAEPVPRLGSPFVELPATSRQHNTFPRSNLIPSMGNDEPFHQRLLQLAAERAAHRAQEP